MINSDGKYAELNFPAYFKFSITFCELSKNIDNFFKNSEIPNFLRLTEVLSNSVATILATDQSENATKPSTGDRLVWHLFNSSMINRWISSEIRAGKSLFLLSLSSCQVDNPHSRLIGWFLNVSFLFSSCISSQKFWAAERAGLCTWGWD